MELQTKVEEHFLCPLEAKKERNGPVSADHGLFYRDPRQPPSEWHFMLNDYLELLSSYVAPNNELQVQGPTIPDSHSSL